MRNLKKVLTLVLTLAMLLSVMVVGAGAAFSDQDSIGNKEAVDMCTALNIIGGYEDGSFRPNGNVTRAEMCKMLCIVLNGGKEPVMSSSGGTYADVERGNWAEPYIEYCTNLGIVGGVGGGNFAPNGNVTGTQAAKMLLVALGFNPATEGYVGSSNWNIEINVDASQKGLYDTLASIDTEAALTRDQAAQMIWNALAAYMVTYRNEFTTVNGQLVAKPVLVDKTSENSVRKITLLEDKYGVYRVEGVVVANEYVTLGKDAGDIGDATAMNAGKTAIVVTNADEVGTVVVGGTTVTGALDVTGPTTNLATSIATCADADTFNVSTGKDEIGKTVVLFVKPAVSSRSTDKATVINKAILYDNNVATISSNMDADEINDALKAEGLKINLPNPVSAPGGAAANSVFYVDGVKNATDFDKAANDNLTRNGYEFQFIDHDGDDSVDLILEHKVDFSKVAAYSTSNDGSITLTGGIKKTDSADVVGFKDVAKDDYVLYSQVGGKLYVEKAPSVTGVLTDYSYQTTGGSNDPNRGGYANLWVDNTKYTNSGAERNGVLTTPVNYQEVDEKATFYLDAYGYVVAIDGDTSAHYALATLYNSAIQDGFFTVARAQLTFENNTVETKDIAAGNYSDTELSTLGSASHNYAKDVVLGSYTYNSDGELTLDNRNVNTIATTATTAPSGDTKLANGDTFKYTSGNILVKFSGANKHGDNLSNDGAHDFYMTDKTVVFMVEPKNGLSSRVDKVTAYVGKDNVPSIDLAYDSGDASSEYKVLYEVDANYEIVAMAIISGENVIGDNYLYVLEVIRSNKEVKELKVVMDNEVKTIQINRVDTKDVAVGGVYEYALAANGKYDIKAQPEASKMTDLLTIEEINVNEKTIVANSTEYKIIPGDTDIVDVAEKNKMEFGELKVGDIIKVLKGDATGNAIEALGIYVLEAYDESNASIVGIKAAGVGKIVPDGAGYKADPATVSAIKGYLCTSSGANVTIYASTGSAGSEVIDTSTQKADGESLADGNVFFIRVTSEDTNNHTDYKLTIDDTVVP